MTLNISKLRAQTPATKTLIHFNNAGAALMPSIVVEGMKSYIDKESQIGGYEAAAYFNKELDLFYGNIAKLINATPQEIAFTESATVAWQRAFHSIPFVKGDIIITCMSEYASNYIGYLQLANDKRVEIKVVSNDKSGAIDIQALEKAITPKVKLISICHIPTGNGLINQAEDVGVIAKKHGVLYLLDACQSVGQYPIDVEKIKCDFLSVTGRKYLRGPRGTGFLYARKETTHHLEPKSLDLHSAEWSSEDTYKTRADAKKYETWESNLSAKYGLSLAVNYLNQIGIEKVYERIIILATYLRDRLNSLECIQTTDTGVNQCGIVTFISNKHKPEEIKRHLLGKKINVSIVVSSSSILDLGKRKINEVVRASVHYYNTEEEIDKVIDLLQKK